MNESPGQRVVRGALSLGSVKKRWNGERIRSAGKNMASRRSLLLACVVACARAPFSLKAKNFGAGQEYPADHRGGGEERTKLT